MENEDAIREQILMRKQVFTSFKLPEIMELENNESCSICLKPFFTGEAIDVPLKLPCGHLFGTTCITTWLSQHDGLLDCPACRQLSSDKKKEHAIWLQSLISCPPRAPGDGGDLTEDETKWAERAEELWKTLCDALVQSLGEAADGDDSFAAKSWLCSNWAVTRRLLILGSIEQFDKERRDDRSTIHWSGSYYPESYHVLYDHLDHVIGTRVDRFLTPDETTHLWLAGLYRKVQADYEKLVSNMTAALESQPSS